MAKKTKAKKVKKTQKKVDQLIALEQHQVATRFLNNRSINLELVDTISPTATELTLLNILLRKNRPVLAKEVAEIAYLTDGAISQAADRLDEILAHFSQNHEALNIKQISIRLPRSGKGGAHFGYYLAFYDRQKDICLSATEAKELSKEIYFTERIRYLVPIKKTLKIGEDVKPKWFRKTGPLAADFLNGTVYEHKKISRKLHELVFDNKILILEGNAGSGKSVLVRQFAYDLITKEKDTQIYYYSFKLNLPISDFREFQDEINRVSGLIIIEDIHLATPDMQCIVEELEKDDNRKILLTARPSFRNNMLRQRSDALKKSPRLSLGQLHDTGKIIEYYAECNSGNGFQWTQKIKDSIKKVSKGNLWLLSYALKGCTGEGESLSWIQKGVLDDLKEIENIDGSNCNPEILLALSPLYMSEILTSHSFINQKLGFDRREITKLVRIGEVIEHDIDGKTYYGLPHSTLAKAYWEFGYDYKNRCSNKLNKSFEEFDDYQNFIYNYSISGVQNGVQAIIGIPYDMALWTPINPFSKTDQDTIALLLAKLARENKALEVIKEEKDSRIYSCLISNMFLYRSLEKYYLSEEFLCWFANLLYERKCFKDLHVLLAEKKSQLNLFCETINTQILLDELYGSDFSNVFLCLSEITSKNNRINSEICNIIDIQKLALRANSVGHAFPITRTLMCLFKINAKLGLEFWDKLDKKAFADFVNTDIRVTGIIFEELGVISKLHKKIKLELCDIVNYEKLLSKLKQSSSSYLLAINSLEFFFNINTDIALSFWGKLDKHHLVSCILDDKQFNAMPYYALGELCKLNEKIKSEIIDLIEPAKLASSITSYDNLEKIISDLDDVFTISEELGSKVWNKLNNGSREKCYNFVLKTNSARKKRWMNYFKQ